MQGLTERQQMVLDYIRQSIVDRGYPPTLREIGARMGIRSTNGVNDHLRALERKGYLTREDMKSRALRPIGIGATAFAPRVGETPELPFDSSSGAPGIPGKAALHAINGGQSNGGSHANGNGAHAIALANANDDDIIEIQILGRVAAGVPLLAEEHVIDTVRIDRGLVKGGREIFGLRVQGDSMIEAGIFSGDYIFVKNQPTASRGDIVVALIGDEATVKYYFPEKDHVRFQPANKTMAPIYVRAVDFRSTMLLGVVVSVFRRL
ncbi:MAG: transcriptional repressor LexA [Polyangiaceae bacterium]